MEFEHLLKKQDRENFVSTDFTWITNEFEQGLGKNSTERGVVV